METKLESMVAYTVRVGRRHVYFHLTEGITTKKEPLFRYIPMNPRDYVDVEGVCMNCCCTGKNTPRKRCPNFVLYGADCNDEGSLLGYCETCVLGKHTLTQLCPMFQISGRRCNEARRISPVVEEQKTVLDIALFEQKN